jgi:hypothetical protein
LKLFQEWEEIKENNGRGELNYDFVRTFVNVTM